MSGPQTGDGDLFDADVHGFEDSDFEPGAPGEDVDDTPGGDDDVRASEVDDLSGVAEQTDPYADVDVEALLAERSEFKDLAQRVQAEYDNFRRQAQLRAQADVERATGKLVEALLPVLDAAEAAYVNHPAEVGPLLNQMLVELKKQGLEAMDLDGAPFDPELAEAVAHEPGDGGEPVVAEVLRSGYTWQGRTLRAAMVRTRD